MRVPVVITLLSLFASPAYAVCNLCVFPILAATGAAAASDARSVWLISLWTGAGTELLILYIAERVAKNTQHLDVSMISAFILIPAFYIAGIKTDWINVLYAAAGISLVHIVLVLHCIVKQYRRIPYLRVILINLTLLIAGFFPFITAPHTASEITAAVGSGFIAIHVFLYLLKIGVQKDGSKKEK